MSEHILDIPNFANWQLKPLDQICTLISRGKGPTYVDKSEVLAIGQRCISDQGFLQQHCRPHDPRFILGHLTPKNGDVLLNSTGTGTIGRSAVFNAEGQHIVDSHVTLLRPRRGLASGGWLNSLLRTEWGQNHLERYCFTGSTNQVELSRKELSSTSVPTPTLGEQFKIAHILDTLDTQIRRTEEIIAKLEQVKQGLLTDLLTRGIDENGERRPSPEEAPELYKDSPLGQIPEAWSLVSLDQCVDSIEQGWSPQCIDQPSGDDEWGILKTSSVTWTGWHPKENKRLPKHLPPRPPLEVFVNDILITRAGPAERVGVVAHVDFVPAKLMVSDKLYRLRCSAGMFDSSYLAKQLSSRVVQTQLKRTISGMAESQTNISQKTFRALLVPRPPLAEQQAVKKFFQSLRRRNNAERLILAELVNHKSGLMDDLLTGRVRVTRLLEQAEQAAG